MIMLLYLDFVTIFSNCFFAPPELASKGVKPKFELAYTTSDLYNLDDLSPASWAGLVERYAAAIYIAAIDVQACPGILLAVHVFY